VYNPLMLQKLYSTYGLGDRIHLAAFEATDFQQSDDGFVNCTTVIPAHALVHSPSGSFFIGMAPGQTDRIGVKSGD
jgi:hypothetical protein